jgi:hypothetical protein
LATPLRRPLLYAVCLAGVTAALFSGVLAGRVLFYRDVHVLYFSYAAVFAKAVREGAWPLWDEGRCFGLPLLAVPDAMILYPTTWLNAVLSGPTSYGVFAVVHLPFGGWGLYRLSRRLGQQRPSALAAAVVFMGSGPLLSLVNVWHHYAGATWMPWVLWAALGALARPGARTIAAWAAALAAQIFAGSADMCAMTALVTGAFILERLWEARRDPATAARVVGAAAAAYAIAAALGAIQWMPTLELTRGSERWSFTEDFRTFWSVHPRALVELLAPFQLSSLPLAASVRSTLFEGREAFIETLYLGLPAAGLVLTALLAGRPRAWLVGAVALGALLISLGRNAPFYHVATTLIPGLGILRYPVKATIVVAFGWAVLAGMGAEAWRRGEIAHRRVLLALFGAAVVFGLVAAYHLDRGSTLVERLTTQGDGTASHGTLGAAAVRVTVAALLGTVAWVLMATRRIQGRTGAAALSVACALDLVSAHHALNKTMPRALLAMRPELLDTVLAEPHERLFVYDYQMPGRSERYLHRSMPFAAREQPGWDRDWALAVALREYMAPPTATPWGIEYAYDPDMHRLFAPPMAELNRRLRAVEGTPAFDRLLRLGSVSHVLTLHTEGLDRVEPVRALQSILVDPMYLSRVPDALPRAWVVDGVRVAEGEAAIEALLDPGFDPAREVVLPAGTVRPPRSDFHGRARVVSTRADAKVVEAELSHDGYLVMSDRYDGGWRVRVDGAETLLLRGNVAFRAVPLAAGKHEVRLLYRPTGLRYGVATSLAGMAALLVVGLAGVRPPNQGRSVPKRDTRAQPAAVHE